MSRNNILAAYRLCLQVIDGRRTGHMNYLIPCLIFFFICLSVPLFFKILELIPSVCPSCKKRKLKKYAEEEQPGYGINIIYKCSHCSHEKNEFIKRMPYQ
ncbi:MAG: hypothetical protein ABRQ38_23405 [Candidatus Eremiobacterota bacterium]